MGQPVPHRLRALPRKLQAEDGLQEREVSICLHPRDGVCHRRGELQQFGGVQEFVELCCKAYNIIRSQGHLFITLFRTMKLAGMPELTCDEDITYLRDMLRLDDSEAQASKHFRSQITLCVLEKWRRWDNAIHNMMHGKG